jgi:rootletin
MYSTSKEIRFLGIKNKELMRLRQRLDEERRKCEKMMQVNAVLRDQFEESHQMNDALTSELQETTQKLKEAENSSETLHKELTDVRRQLAYSSYEKEKYNSSNKELRDYVKRIEGKKREQGRSLKEAHKRISALEDAKTGLEIERTRLQAQVRDLEQQQLQTSHQLQSVHEELQRPHASNAQIQNEEKELHQLKKQIVELDGSLDVSRQELSRMRSHGEEEEERWRGREQELLVRLEDSRGRERKLEDQRHNLEVYLADATQQIQELKDKSDKRQELFNKIYLKPYTEIKHYLNAKSVNEESPTSDKKPNKEDLDY